MYAGMSGPFLLSGVRDTGLLDPGKERKKLSCVTNAGFVISFFGGLQGASGSAIWDDLE